MKRVIYQCDDKDCEVWDYSLGVVIRGQDKQRKHFCLEHYPYEHCAGCGCKLRPFRTSVGKWPGTKSKQGSNPPRCPSCAVGGGSSNASVDFIGDQAYPMDEGDMSSALAYLERHDALDVAWMLGLKEVVE